MELLHCQRGLWCGRMYSQDLSPWGMKYCLIWMGLSMIPCDPDGHNQRYWDSTPFLYGETVNRLCDEGNKIVNMTARGGGSGMNWTELTTEVYKSGVSSIMNLNLFPNLLLISLLMIRVSMYLIGSDSTTKKRNYCRCLRCNSSWVCSYVF